MKIMTILNLVCNQSLSTTWKQGYVVKIRLPSQLDSKSWVSGMPGEGAGRGGGAGGSVRESGGGLGKYGAAKEEEYFFRHQREQLEKMKIKLKKESLNEPEPKNTK